MIGGMSFKPTARRKLEEKQHDWFPVELIWFDDVAIIPDLRSGVCGFAEWLFTTADGLGGTFIGAGLVVAADESARVSDS